MAPILIHSQATHTHTVRLNHPQQVREKEMELDEIDSPSDFVHLSFSTLDSTLRCPICKSLFLAPVSFSTCFHTFCSKCIRFNLASKEGSSTCPSCGIGVDDGKLKVNPVVGQIVEAYREGRGKLLQLEKATTVGAKKKIGKVKRKTKGDDGDSSDVEIIEPEPSTSKLQSSKGKQKRSRFSSLSPFPLIWKLKPLSQNRKDRNLSSLQPPHPTLHLLLSCRILLFCKLEISLESTPRWLWFWKW